MRKTLKRIRKSYHNGYIVIVATAVVMFWHGMFGLLDTYLFPSNPVIGYFFALIVGLSVLFFNDFKLDELE